MVIRERKSRFVKLFDKTPPQVICPHFYELILSNGCPYNCAYCYLKLTFRGAKSPNLFNNAWPEVQKELDKIGKGVFNTGELADSLAIIPPLLAPAVDYFTNGVSDKYLLIVTKSTNVDMFLNRPPHENIIISFSINDQNIARKYEKGAPSPLKRLAAAKKLKEKGWRIRIRLDPIILENGVEQYRGICEEIKKLDPEVVTIGSLRQFPGVHAFSKDAPKEGLAKAPDGRMRYPQGKRVVAYKKIAEWLERQPALCKETKDVWNALGWSFTTCNCTV